MGRKKQISIPLTGWAAKDIAQVYNLTAQAVGLWHRNGGCPRDENGTYDIRRVVEWHEAKLAVPEGMESARGGGNSPALERYRSARADVAEHERDLLTGKLVEKAEAEEEMLAKCNFLSQALDAFAAVLSERLSTEAVIPPAEITTVERSIQDEVDTFKKYLSGEDEEDL